MYIGENIWGHGRAAIIWRIAGVIIALAISSSLTPTSRDAGKSAIHRVSVMAFLAADGSASVEETWDMTIRGGTENYKQLFGMLNERVDGFSVSENGVPYQPLAPWNTKLSRDRKAGRYGVNQTRNGPELCWGIGTENGRRSYTIRYNLRDIVTLHDDQDGHAKAALYWQFIGKKFQRAERVEVRVAPPNPIGPDHHFWIFGFDGTIDVQSHNYHIQARKVRPGHFVELALIMPAEDFPGAKRIGYQKLNAIRKNGPSGDELGRFKAKAPPSSEKIGAMSVSNEYMIVLLLVFGAYFMIVLGKPLSIPISRQTPRSTPPEETLEAIAHLLSAFHKTPELLNTFMITWIYKKHIRLERESGALFGSGGGMIYLDSRPESFDGPYEARLFHVVSGGLTMRRGTSADAYRLYLKNYKTKALLDIDNDFKQDSGQYCRDRGWLTRNKFALLHGGNEPLWAALWGILWAVPAFLHVCGLVAAVPFLVSFLAVSRLPNFRLRGLSPEGREVLEEVLGFANFLCNYSLMGTRGVEHIELWDSYMAFAHLLGIADKLEKELSKLVPTYRIDSPCAVYIHSGVYSGSLRSSYSPNPVFGGGSGSSGGGGGGSGGGGGGGTR